MQTVPFVSIIIPFFNAEKTAGALAESLLRLKYPKDSFEVICVDNRSRDNTKKILRNYPFRLLEESRIQSSYAARNRGIAAARGEILAFTDSDCIVTPQWLMEGIASLQAEADLAGGPVEFFFGGDISFAQVYDSMMGMRNDDYIARYQRAVTANLFSKTEVFKQIGLFPFGVASGGDGQWTSRAVRAGFRLVYASGAVVRHPARRLPELLKKNYRVGTGSVAFWKQQRMSKVEIAYSAAKLIIPRRPFFLYRRMEQCGGTKSLKIFFAIWLIDYLCSFAKLTGILLRKKFDHDRL